MKRSNESKNQRFVFVLVLTIISSIICFPTLIDETVKNQVDFFDRRQCKINCCSLLLLWKRATLRNKGNLGALNMDNCEEHPRSNLAQISNFPRSQEDYITQVSDEIERRVTKTLSQYFLQDGEPHFMRAITSWWLYLLNPPIQGHSGIAPETSRNTLRTIQGTNENSSQSDPQPEAGVSQSGNTLNSGPSDTWQLSNFTSTIKSTEIWGKILQSHSEELFPWVLICL